jgi:iron complex transport system permease protein
MLGSGFLILADAASRSITMQNTHGVLPVGILTALLGGPFFLWILFRKN